MTDPIKLAETHEARAAAFGGRDRAVKVVAESRLIAAAIRLAEAVRSLSLCKAAETDAAIALYRHRRFVEQSSLSDGGFDAELERLAHNDKVARTQLEDALMAHGRALDAYCAAKEAARG